MRRISGYISYGSAFFCFIRSTELSHFCSAKVSQVRTLFSMKIEQPFGYSIFMAERTGFEPAIALPQYTLSKRAPSTTRPSLHILYIIQAAAQACAYRFTLFRSSASSSSHKQACRRFRSAMPTTRPSLRIYLVYHCLFHVILMVASPVAPRL